MKKILFLVFLVLSFIPISLSAVSSNDVRYEVYDYIVDARIDASGNLNVKEVIGIKGTFNGYIRDIVYKNSLLTDFTGKDSDFEGSKIYNASNVEIIKVGTVDFTGDLDFTVFENKVSESNICSNSKGCYYKSSITDGISLKMYNETSSGITYFYIEYLLGNVAVVHEDVAEVYYNFIGDKFDDDIRRYQLRLNLPFSTLKDVRVWAHGPLTGNVGLLKSDDELVGGYLEINDLPANTPVDMRMVFPKDMIAIEHPYLKKSGVLAFDKIIDVEMERADEANKQRKIARIKVYGTYIATGIYFVGLLIFFIYIYVKYDKERISQFQNEYNREFIDDYDVTVIEYLFNRKVSEKGFSTSILNMIYKKNIKFEQIDKKEYKFLKVNDNNLTDAEKLVMEIIFDDAGNGKEVTLGEIKKYAKKLNNTSSPFLNKFNKWKQLVTSDGVSQEFFESNVKIRVFGILYAILGFVIMSFHMTFGIFNVLTVMLIICSAVFLLYVCLFTKKTVRGIEHYSKWKAFKKFLLDFGRFDEKELPQIVLWERYLVYASIFGIADKVSKVMKVKFSEMNYQASNRDILFDYVVWSHLNSSLTRTVSSSISTARVSVSEAASSSYSSGGGFGGGFSSGGGFGGGGGGGRGF